MIKATDYIRDKIKREIIEELRANKPKTWLEAYTLLEYSITKFLEKYKPCDWYEVDYIPSDSPFIPSTFFTASIRQNLYNIVLKPSGDILVTRG